MKAINAALQSHYASGTTTLATCWKATLTNGTIIAATAFDSDIVFGGITYRATQSYTASDIESTSELNPDNLEIQGVLGSPAITDADIHSGLWDYAAIEVFEVNYLDLTQGRNLLRAGTLGEVRGGRSKFVAEMRGLFQSYTRTIVRLVTKECTADFGDTRCGIDTALSTVSGAVQSVVDNRIISDSARTEAADWYAGAKLTFTSGANTGRSMEVQSSAPGILTLSHAMYDDIEVGDAYQVYAGCTKRFNEDCISKHNNGINFRGFPHLPGTRIYRRGGIDYGVQAAQISSGGTATTPPPTVPPPAPPTGGTSLTPTLYVASTGSNTNSGLTAAAPFATIAHAASVAQPGDIVSVAAGVYAITSGTSGIGTVGISTSCSGTATSPIIFISASPWGARLVDSGLGITWQHSGNYTIIDGFEITGSQRIGIYLTGNSCEVRGNYIHDLLAHGGANGQGGAAIDGIGANMYVHGNRINNIDVAHFTGTTYVQGIYIAGAGWRVENNIVSNVAAVNITQWHAATGSIIVNNTVFHSKEGILIGDGDAGTLPGGSSNNIVANNIVFDHTTYGIVEGGITGTNNQYLNNLVFNSGNNVSLHSGAVQSGTVLASPQFVDYQTDGSGDYRLQAGSPAIGAGNATYEPATDYAGTTRGTRADIGAYVGP